MSLRVYRMISFCIWDDAFISLCPGDQGASKARPLVIQYQDMMQSFEQADNELTLLRDNLEGKSAVPVEESMQRDTAAKAAAPMGPRPPRITQHLKNAEVMEGVK